MNRKPTILRHWLATLLAAVLMAAAPDMAWGQTTKQAVVVGSSGNVTAVKDGTADAVSTTGKTYVETTSGNTVTITTAAPPAGKVAKVTVRSYTVSSASDVKVPVTALTVAGTGGATEVNKGLTLQMIATAAPTYADWKSVTWSVASDTESDTPGTATIDATTGVLTGTEEGDVIVTATATDGSGVTGQLPVTVIPVPNYTIMPLTVQALADGKIQIQSPKVGMKYSIDGGDKVSIESEETKTIEVSQGQKVQFYGNGTSITSYNGTRIKGENGDVGEFRCKVYGNIMSLVDETGYATNTTLPSTTTFVLLFFQNQHLTDASGLVLPAMTLTASCYEGMFGYCPLLTAAPDLPATTVAVGCYNRMFQGCTSLTSVPATLPAMTMAQDCYKTMFNGCTSLTTAPDLPATTVAIECYNGMFQDCTSLTSVPATLPATTLAERCYNAMFFRCSNLTTAPVLPAPTLVKQCYWGMFYQCSLNSITCLATNISAENCTQNWVYGVPTSGTFTKASSMTGWTTGVNGIPSGWDVVDYVAP